MKAHYDEYLKEIVANYKTDAHKDRVMFVRCYSDVSLDSDGFQEIITDSGVDCELLCHEFKVSEVQSPYEPFLLWIRKAFLDVNQKDRESEVEKLLDEAKVYYLHRPIIKNYILKGKAKREEDVIISEIKYEHGTMIKSIVNLIDCMWNKRPVIMLLHNIGYAHKSTIELIHSLLKNKNDNISIIAEYNELYTCPDYMSNYWFELVKFIQDKNFLVESDSDKSEESYDHDVTDIYDNEELELEESLKKIRNLSCFLENEEAAYYIEHIYTKCISELGDVRSQSKVNIYELYSYISICIGNLKNAFFMCKKLSDIKEFVYDKRLEYKYNFLMALIKCYDRQREQAFRYVEECEKIARILGDDDLAYNTEMLRNEVCCSGWSHVFAWDSNLKVSETFIEESIKRKQYNHLSYLYFSALIPTYDYSKAMEDDWVRCDKSEYFIEGLKYNAITGNTKCLLRAYQKQIILVSANGRYEDIEYYYDKCIAICKESQEIVEESNLYNGIAYYNVTRGDYKKADSYLKKAADIMIKFSGVENLTEVIYNMIVNAVACRDYDTAIYYFDCFTRIMNIIRFSRIRVCNLTKIYGLVTIAYIRTGRSYDSKIYLRRIKTSLRHLLDKNIEPDYNYWEDDIFLYYMVLGMYNKEEGNYQSAEKAFLEGLRLREELEGNQDYIFFQYILEFAELYNKIGNFEKKKEILEFGANICKEKNYFIHLDVLERFMTTDDFHGIFDDDKLERFDSSKMEKILDIAYLKGVELELEEKKKSLLFFENWVDLINKENTKMSVVLENAINSVKNTYDIDSVLWLEIPSQGQAKIQYADKEINLTRDDIDEIYRLFDERRKNIVINRSERAFDNYKDLVRMFGLHDVFAIAGIPIIVNERVSNIIIVVRRRHMNFVLNTKLLEADNVDILKTTFRQLIDSRKREKLRMELRQRSVTDVLTGILNRQGMQQFLDAQFEWSGSSKKEFTILYLDLDNFKYCNDNFGHNVGDTVLVCFANMLKGALQDESKVIRYGGDEFLAILPHQDEEEGVRVAKRIFTILDETKGFYDEIIKSYGSNVEIEEKNRVSCSIGISSGMCSDVEDVIKLLKNADAALYEVKRSTKHDYRVS